MTMMKTFSAKAEEVERKWHLIDASGKILGQVAVEAAKLIRGKHKPIYTSHCDTGDYVVVINAKDVVLSGKKETDKIYTRHSGYVGGQKIETPKSLREKKPEDLIYKAVWGMIPHNRLGRSVFKKLRVFADDKHDHVAQQPEPFEIK